MKCQTLTEPELLLPDLWEARQGQTPRALVLRAMAAGDEPLYPPHAHVVGLQGLDASHFSDLHFREGAFHHILHLLFQPLRLGESRSSVRFLQLAKPEKV